jgi:hypothetical protein
MGTDSREDILGGKTLKLDSYFLLDVRSRPV